MASFELYEILLVHMTFILQHGIFVITAVLLDTTQERCRVCGDIREGIGGGREKASGFL